MSKYGNEEIKINGHKFDSKAEGKHYLLLLSYQRAGRITDLKLQPVFPYYGKSKKPLFKYIADFSYLFEGKTVIEDVKGVRTPVFNLKKKLIEDQYGIEIQLIK